MTVVVSGAESLAWDLMTPSSQGASGLPGIRALPGRA